MTDVLRLAATVAGETEAILTEWLAAEGSALAPGDVVATVETAKASFDVEAESAGILLKQLVRAGEEVTAGTPLAVTGAPGETAENAVAMASAPAGRIFISPIARRLARQAGLEIASITGTGPNGRIIRRDVEAASVAQAQVGSVRRADAAPVARPALPEAAEPRGVPEPPSLAQGARDIQPSRLRRAIATRLTLSKQTTPHFYLRGTADAEKLCRLKDRLNTSSHVKITLNDLVIKAVAQAHTRVPAMNVIWTADAVRSFTTVDLSVAIATDDGLVAPVIRAADRLSLSTIAAFIREQAEHARNGRLRQQDLEGGVATVTNLGMYGTAEFAAIINPPQSAILAVGAVREQPVARHGKVRIRRVLTVTLSVDHRPIDGVTAARWMREFTALLEEPAQILV